MLLTMKDNKIKLNGELISVRVPISLLNQYPNWDIGYEAILRRIARTPWEVKLDEEGNPKSIGRLPIITAGEESFIRYSENAI